MPTVPGGIAPASDPVDHASTGGVFARGGDKFGFSIDSDDGPIHGPDRDSVEAAHADLAAHLAGQPIPD